jgi:hypothetical protein
MSGAPGAQVHAEAHAHLLELVGEV